jgi:hypothetical protein
MNIFVVVTVRELVVFGLCFVFKFVMCRGEYSVFIVCIGRCNRFVVIINRRIVCMRGT